MKPSKDNVFRLLAQLEQAGALPGEGPTSVFVSSRAGIIPLRP